MHPDLHYGFRICAGAIEAPNAGDLSGLYADDAVICGSSTATQSPPSKHANKEQGGDRSHITTTSAAVRGPTKVEAGVADGDPSPPSPRRAHRSNPGVSRHDRA